MRKTALMLTNEDRLLILVADSSMRQEPPDEELRNEAASMLGSVFDWRRFMKLAGHHMYLAATARFFKTLGTFEGLPEDVRGILEGEYFLSQARFTKKEYELIELVRDMEKEAVAPIVIKGIPLAYSLYNDPGVRVSKDIDILVPRSDLERCQRVLQKNGYFLRSGRRSAEEYRAYHFHYIYCRGENLDSVVELHWDLLDPTMDHAIPDEARLRERAIPLQVGGTTIRTLSPPDAFWYMGMHAAYKCFLAFRSLAEMKGMARRFKESDWNEVILWSARCNTDREMTLATSLCESLFGRLSRSGTAVGRAPGFFMKRFILSTYYPRALVWEWLPFRDTHEFAMELYLRKGFRHRALYLYRLVFPDRVTLTRLYFNYRTSGVKQRIRLHLNGLYVLMKVLLVTLFMGFLVRSEIIGPRMLDPERNR
ncbi:MAG: nucleotidyltransferase family protein [Candidatus Krumholzibacteria bacterium]|nr:nucleotidyltransferase family protein [Candidatus Krumholzibacteria bacterium]